MSDILAATLAVRIKAMMEGFQQEMEKTSAGIKSVSDKIEDHKEQLRKAGTVIAGIGAAITGSLALAVTSAANFGDEMDEMSSRTGVSTEKLSALALAVETSGGSMDTLETSIKRAQRNLYEAANGSKQAQEAFNQLGISIKNSDGSLRDAVDVMIDFADKTADMEDETMKAALAQKIFGRSGTDLLPVFELGGEGIRKLMKDAEKYGMTIDSLTAKQAGEFNDSFDTMKMAIAGVARQFGYTLLPAITPVIEAITDLAAKVVDFLREHERFAQILGGVATALGLILTAVGGLLVASTGLPALIGLFTKMSSLLAGTGPFGLALAAVAIALYEIAKHWDVVSAAMLTFYNQVAVPVTNALVTAFNTVWGAVKDTWNWIDHKVREVLTGIGKALMPVIDFFIQGFNTIWQVVDKVFTWVWDKATAVISKMYNAFRWMLDKLGVELPELSDIFGKIKETGENAASAVSNKWEAFKNEFALHMEMNAIKNDLENKKIVKNHVDSLDIQLQDTKDNAAATEKVKKESVAKQKTTEEQHIAELRKMYGEFLTEQQLKEIEKLQKAGKNYKEYIELCNKENAQYLDQYKRYLSEEQMAQARTLFAMGLDWKTYVEGIVTPQIEAILNKYKDTLTKSEQETVLKLNQMGLDWEGYARALGASKSGNPATQKGTLFAIKDVYVGHMNEMQRNTYERLKEMGLDWEAYANNIISEKGPWARMQVRIDTYFNELRVIANESFQKVGDGFVNDVLHGKFHQGIENMKAGFANAFDSIKENLISKLSSALSNWITSQLVNYGKQMGAALFSGMSGEGGLLSQLGSAISGLFSGSGGAGGIIGGALGAAGTIAGAGAVGAAVYFGGKALMDLFEGVTGTSEETRKKHGSLFIQENGGTALKAFTAGASQNELNMRTFQHLTEVWAYFLTDQEKASLLANTTKVGSWAKQINSGTKPSGYSTALGNVGMWNGLTSNSVLPQNILAEIDAERAKTGESRSEAFERIKQQKVEYWGSDYKFGSTFHQGGIIPGMIGQEKQIVALAGEEVLTRNDPRHKDNIGAGFTVIISGNNINSALDVRELGRIAGDEILRKIRLRESLSF